jgi:hypothetical protein
VLHIVQRIDDPLIRLVADDPVRPEIPREFRVGPFSEIFVLSNEDGSPAAAVCCAYRAEIPTDVVELAQLPVVVPTVAVFYTIWSYQPGAGRRLITQTRRWIQLNRVEVRQFVTLSPPTEMARVFHLRNGAEVHRVNVDTVNYLYP